MEIHQILPASTVVLAGLAAGVFFTFTALVIPGLRSTDPRAALQGFKAIDSRLQPTATSVDWQPIFGTVVFGTSPLTIATAVVGWTQFSSTGRVLAIAAAAIYNLGFWLPTVFTIVPFNNRVRDADLDHLEPSELHVLYRSLERNWRDWNLLRTAASTATFGLLVALVTVG